MCWKLQTQQAAQQPAAPTATATPQQNTNSQPQIIQLQTQQTTPPAQNAAGGIQIIQQIVGADGQIQQIPVSAKFVRSFRIATAAF